MKQWINDGFSKKKVRGLKRRCRTFSRYIDEQLDSFPIPKNPDPSYPGYASLHLRFDEFFTDSKKVPSSVRRFFVQTILKRIHCLLETRTEAQREYRIFYGFTPPDLGYSFITILFTKKGMESFYEGFFSREAEGERLIRLHHTQNLETEWGLHIPKGLNVKGYKPDVDDDEYEYDYQDEMWFVGRLD